MAERHLNVVNLIQMGIVIFLCSNQYTVVGTTVVDADGTVSTEEVFHAAGPHDANVNIDVKVSRKKKRRDDRFVGADPDAAEHHCADLEITITNSGILTADMHALYCKHVCTFDKFIRCVRVSDDKRNGKGPKGGILDSDIAKLIGLDEMESARVRHEEIDPVSMIGIKFDYDTAMIIGRTFFWFIFIPIGAILNVHYFKGNSSFGVLYWIVTSLAAFLINDLASAIFYTVASSMCMIIPVSTLVPSIMLSTSVLLMFFLVLAMVSSTNVVWQCFICVALVASVWSVMYRAYFSKNVFDAFPLIGIVAQLGLLSPMVNMMLETFGKKFLAGPFINFILGMVMPYSTNYNNVTNKVDYLLSTQWRNVHFMASYMTEKFLNKDDVLFEAHIYYSIILVGFISFFLVRAFVGYGTAIRLTVCKGNHFFALVIGLYIYMIDVWTSPGYMVSALYRHWYSAPNTKFDIRNFGYHAVISLMVVHEFWYANDFAVVRIILWFVDFLLMPDGIRNAHRMLNSCEFDVVGFYPVDGSLPWVDVAFLSEVSRSTVNVIFNNCRGSGLIIKQGKEVGLTTVEHVAKDNDGAPCTISFSNAASYIIDKLTWSKMSTHSDDPVVIADLAGTTYFSEIRNKYGVELSTLKKEQIKDLVMLYISRPDGKGCIVTEFTNRGTYIDVASDFLSGNSGSPVVGFFKTGKPVLVGAVVRGTISNGAPNHISVALGELRAGSPGLDGSTTVMVQQNFPKAIIDKLTTMFAERHDMVEAGEMSYDADIKRHICHEMLDVTPFDSDERDRLKSAYDAGDQACFVKSLRAGAYSGIGYVSS